MGWWEQVGRSMSRGIMPHDLVSPTSAVGTVQRIDTPKRRKKQAYNDGGTIREIVRSVGGLINR